MKRVAIANLKGGVGKSTTTLFVAEHWAMTGRRVLVVDLDPQANSSFMLLSREGLRQAEIAHKTVPHLFEDAQRKLETQAVSYISDASDLVELRNGLRSGYVKLLPAVPWLWFEEYEFDRLTYLKGQDPVQARYEVLVNFLARVERHFDVVIFDCPPGFSSLTRCAVRLADLIVSPTLADDVSMRSLRDFTDLGLISALKIDPEAKLRVVVQKYTATNQQRANLDRLRNDYKVVEPAIPARDQVQRASTRLHDVMRTYSDKYRRPRLNPLSPHVKAMCDALQRCVF